MTNKKPNIILGTAQLGMPYGFGKWRGSLIPEKEVFRIIDFAWKNGVRTFDTSPEYGVAESRVSQYFSDNTEKKFHVISKIKNVHSDLDRQKEQLNQWFEECPFRRNGNCASISMLLHTETDIFQEVIWTNLDLAVKRKQINCWGVSVYGEEAMRHALTIEGCHIIQAPFGLFNQKLLRSGVLEDAALSSKILHARSLFNRGLLFSPTELLSSYGEEVLSLVAELSEYLKPTNISLSRFAIDFVLRQRFFNGAVVGFDSVSQLQDCFSNDFEESVLNIPEEFFERARNIQFTY